MDFIDSLSDADAFESLFELEWTELVSNSTTMASARLSRLVDILGLVCFETSINFIDLNNVDTAS